MFFVLFCLSFVCFLFFCFVFCSVPAIIIHFHQPTFSIATMIYWRERCLLGARSIIIQQSSVFSWAEHNFASLESPNIHPPALPFLRWYVCKAIKTPIFSITLTKDSIYFYNLTQRPYCFTKLCAATKSTLFFRKNEIFTPNDSQFMKFFITKKYFFLQIWSKFSPKSRKM